MRSGSCLEVATCGDSKTKPGARQSDDLLTRNAYRSTEPADRQVASVLSTAYQMTPLASEQNERTPVAPGVTGTATELKVDRGVPVQFPSDKVYPCFVPDATTASMAPVDVELMGEPPAGGPSSLRVQVNPISG